ncbi:hypothetical protein NQ315_016857 [Exocentrus adspersus]|uniref:Uncharacterized protein n=1 Tax=Exocentrus adspersus TaxID=1586481 RepID=A0AAV8VXK3_9CUCU|nr:hypothetical protein NQ315_016857 [Exocentrus adspersus]
MAYSNEIVMEFCRLCQKRSGQTSLQCDNELFINKLESITGIQVNDEVSSYLPNQVCLYCENKILDIYNYIQTVQTVDKSLRNVIRSKCLHHDKTGDSNKYEQVIEIVFQCENCPEVFQDQNLLDIHAASHTDEKKHKRPVRFKTKPSYKIHPKLDCSICLKTFDNVSDERIHVCTETEEVQIETTSRCKNKTINEDVLQCNMCDEKYKSKAGLRLHLKIHRTFVCRLENCHKQLPSARSLKLHQLDHLGKNRYLCVTCEVTYSVTKKIHSDIKQYKCEQCNIGFSARSNLRAHEKKYHEGVRYYCSQCAKVFMSKYSLERHEKIHTGIKEFRCEKCESAFYTKKELNKHQSKQQQARKDRMADENDNEKMENENQKSEKMFSLKKWNAVAMWSWDVECDTCAICRVQVMDACLRCQAESKKDSYGKQDCVVVWGGVQPLVPLLLHVAVGEAEQPVSAVPAGSGPSSGWGNRGWGLRNYKCEVCYKTFFERHHLITHVRSHNGERPYTCQVPGCGKAFAEGQKLKRHHKAKHSSIGS